MISRINRRRLVRVAINLVKKTKIYGGSLPGGVSSKFLKISESFGARITYADGVESVVDTFRNHFKAWKMGLAPYCFGLFRCVDSQGNNYYGYIVQTVKVLVDWANEIFGDDAYWRGEYKNDYTKSGINRVDRVGKRLYHSIKRKLGFYCSDCHFGNAGWLGNKLVCIDFGSEGRYD